MIRLFALALILALGMTAQAAAEAAGCVLSPRARQGPIG